MTNIAFSAGQDLACDRTGQPRDGRQVDGVVLYTYGMASDPAKPNTETGIALHAASGSVVASSNTGATRLTASGAIDVTSTKTNVLVASPQQILLAAAGAAIQIDSGSITINAPGAVEFKAGMKDLTSAASASTPAIQLPTASLVMPDKYSARMDVYDYFVRHHFVEVPYAAKLDDGSFVSGTLDKHGRSLQIYASKAQSVKVLVGTAKDEWDMIFDDDALDRALPKG